MADVYSRQATKANEIDMLRQLYKLETGANSAISPSGHSHVSEAKIEIPEYRTGHYHYTGCINDTLELFKLRTCGCPIKEDGHAESLVSLAKASKGRMSQF